jgi:hypothetical protein
VRNEEVLRRVKRVKSILREIKHGKANWTVHTLPRNSLLKHLVEGKGRKIEGKGREDDDEEIRCS